jgi:hypothetical protein
MDIMTYICVGGVGGAYQTIAATPRGYKEMSSILADR